MPMTFTNGRILGSGDVSGYERQEWYEGLPGRAMAISFCFYAWGSPHIFAGKLRNYTASGLLLSMQRFPLQVERPSMRNRAYCT